MTEEEPGELVLISEGLEKLLAQVKLLKEEIDGELSGPGD